MKVKPEKSSWLNDSTIAGSRRVSLADSMVKSLSKFLMSLALRCKKKNTIKLMQNCCLIELSLNTYHVHACYIIDLLL